MNILEYQMIDVLKILKNEYGVFEIKAEFEAEGSRMEEMMRLKDITTFVGLPIILKIGGVEAVTDIYNALSIGVKGIIAPMVETPFALSKFLNLIKNMIPQDNAKDIEFAFNLETFTAYKNIDEMFKLPNVSILSGVTIGRVDLTGSMGLDREAINTSSDVYDVCETILSKTKKNGLKTGLGGGISKETLPIITKLTESKLLDKFETRKVVFPAASYKHGYAAILKALEFELLWLQSKRRFYSRIKVEDENRIAMLEKRVNT
ncbi:MAG: aldolase/citrate lyase family protein [Candidatus Omnitrophota bacterium]|nr:aldolase/citrate lyase family protein [Candidatus Omnitrophota bacterium]